MKKAEKKAITLASLKNIYKELPKLAKTNTHIVNEFNMGLYGTYEDLKIEVINQQTECMTHGCGLGNSARVFDLVDSDFELSTRKFSYLYFSRRILPSCFDEHHIYPQLGSVTNDLWVFLFHSDWIKYQPTFKQFIERVKYAIDTKLEIGDWNYQTTTFKKK